MAQQRVREAKKLGFETVILPRVCENTVGEAEGVELVFVSTIAEAVEAIR